MNDISFQSTLSRVLALGGAAVAIFLVTGNVTDPVNAPKFFLLGGLAGAAISLIAYLIIHKSFRITGLEMLVSAFILWSLVAALFSSSPISQGLYGVYGRNTGFLTYAFLGVIAIASTQLLTESHHSRLLVGFLIAFLVNLIYGLWVLLFGDFLGWQNNYGALLGTFGNPNFISSFLGMGFSLVLALAVKANHKKRAVLVLCLPFIAWQLVETKSLQGLVVCALGTTIVVFFWITHISKSSFYPVIYLIIGMAAAVTSLAGALGSGPFKAALSQPTIALREQYWLAAVQMAKSQPVFGVGMDAYGDWYRRARDSKALILPGAETVTNAAHNVFLDVLAYGGFPLLVIYLGITGLGFLAIIRTAKRNKKYDTVFVGLTVLWFGYQAQSLISINQIGLAVWGWILNGSVIAYEMNSRTAADKVLEIKKVAKVEIFSPRLFSSLGVLIGLLISVPPIASDLNWRNVLKNGEVAKLEKSLEYRYLNPLNSYRLSEAVRLLENSKLPDYAIKYARIGVQFNSQYFDAWRNLYYATNSTSTEKSRAKSEMIRLDPLNKAWRELE
jgi:O-antigen ligase